MSKVEAMEKKFSWSEDATKIFKGKVIDKIEYLSQQEADEMDWRRTPVIMFTDGSWIMTSGDDEGNQGGAFFTSSRLMPTIPQGGW